MCYGKGMTKPRPLPDLETLRNAFRVENGLLIRLRTGKPAGTADSWGYLQARLGKRLLSVHRVVWKLHFGEEPPPQLDHVNRDKRDNRIENLRVSDASRNALNRKCRADSKTQVQGVTRRHRKWYYRLQLNGVRYTRGPFNTAGEAHQAYIAEKAKVLLEK